MRAPKCQSISNIVANDRRLTSLAEALRTAHFSGTLSAILQARQPSAEHSVHIICHINSRASPHPDICADTHILCWSALMHLHLIASMPCLAYLQARAVQYLGRLKELSLGQLNLQSIYAPIKQEVRQHRKTTISQPAQPSPCWLCRPAAARVLPGTCPKPIHQANARSM